MNSFLLWVGGLMVAVLGLLFAVPHVIDWNAYRGVFEEEASRILGRDVRVGGKVNLRLLPSPYVRFEKVRISDSGASLGEPFFRAEAFTLWLAPTPLLKGVVEASELELDRPVLRLAVDAEGRGNWQAFKIAPGAVPFIPSDVVLQQVRIKQGIVSLRTEGVTEPLTLSAIDGEVSAASLDGPYRFRGMVDWQGARRELRIGTSQREADGKLRYKASVRSPDNGNSYLVDGEISEISARAKHTGSLSAKLPLSGFLQGLLPSDARSTTERNGEIIDLRATIAGDIDGARLTDMAFAFEHRGKPQMVGGEMAANWRNGLRLDTRLASRWLDLDTLLGQAGSNAAPVATVRRIIEQASSMLPSDGTSLVTIDIDQVTLGGEALSGVRLALARAGGLTSIGELRAALPGNARGSLRGQLASTTPTNGTEAATQPAAATDIFTGDVVLRGASYQRFAAWAGMTALAANRDGAARLDDAFSIASRVRLLPAGLILSQAQLELGGRQISGSVDWRWGDNRSLDIAAVGHAIDIGAFAPGALDLTTGGNGQPEAAEEKSARASASGMVSNGSGFTGLDRLTARAAIIERAVGRLGLTLKAGELADGATRMRDVDAEIAIRDGGIVVTALGLTGASGVRMELQGALAALQTKPAGTLRGWAKAADPAATATMLQALPAAAKRIAGRWLSEATTADFGFSLTLGGASPDHLQLRADGLLDQARTVLELGLDGGLGRWQDGPIRLALDIDGSAAGSLIRHMAGHGRGNSSTAGPSAQTASVTSTGRPHSASLQIRAAGVNAASLIADARLETGAGTDRATADYKGRVALSPTSDIELGGQIELAAKDAADFLVLAGATHRPFLPGTGVRGKLEMERKAGVTRLTSRGIDVGKSRVGGQIVLSTRGDRTRIDGKMTADRLSIAGLLGLLLDGEAKPAGSSDASAGLTRAGPSPWPDAPFSMALLDGTEGLVTISAPLASLSQELEFMDAEARIAFGPRRVDIQAITGAALGGRFTARGTIEGGLAGAGVSLDARLTGAQLAQLAGGTKNGSGEVNATLTLSGRAQSPRAVMAAAVGRGEVEIRNGRVGGIAASLIEKAASVLIDTAEPVDRAAIERLIRTERARSFTPIGSRKLPIEVVDGALRIGALEITAPEASLRNVTTLDLIQLQADSEWQIVPRRALPRTTRGNNQRNEQPLPPMSLVWTGSLGGIARLEPRLSIDNLEREIQIRKMERDAEKLEELRRQDEERIRLEQERQRQLQIQLQEGGERSGAAPGTGAPAGTAPIIVAPLPVPERAQPAAAAPAKGAEAAPPLPRVIRPTARPRAETKTLQDILMGQ